MRRIVRDTWAWRGAFAPDELRYTPALADATRGPIAVSARNHWPVLTSQLEAAWSVPNAASIGIFALTGPAAAHLALVGRTGGYHAVLPRELPELEPVFEEIRCGDDAIPTFSEALDLLEEGGVIERTTRRLALLRPPPATPVQMRQMRDCLDDHEHVAPDDPVSNRLLRAVWRQTYSGIGVGRFRELARFGRLRVTIDLTKPAGPADPFFEVGVGSLPELPGDLVTDRAHPHPERAGIALRRVVLRTGPDTDVPLLATAHEVGALLLGGGEGANAVRRAVRGTVVWLLLVEHAGWRAGVVDVPMATLATQVAELLGLKVGADHRKLVRLLLQDLQRTGLAVPTTAGGLELVPPKGPDDATARRALDAWTAWRLGLPADPPARVARLVARHREAAVRGPWARALEQRRVHVDVLPGRDA